MKKRKVAVRLALLTACCLSLAACEYITAQTIPDNGQNPSQDRTGSPGGETRNGLPSRNGGGQTGP